MPSNTRPGGRIPAAHAAYVRRLLEDAKRLASEAMAALAALLSGNATAAELAEQARRTALAIDALWTAAALVDALAV